MLTKGWDTISIVKLERINSDLAGVWAGVDSHFSYTSSKPEVHINGLFACWSIIEGGGGRILRLKLPIQSGEITLGQTKVNLENTSAIIEITLSLLPSQNNITVLKSEYQNLAKNRSEMIPETNGWVLPITFLDSGGKVGALSNVVLDSICKYLISNPKQFELIFAEISFAKSGSPTWAIPQKCAYSYLDSGYLAILSVCSDKNISQLPLDVDITGISLGASSFYVMSSELMLKNLILPGLADIYQNCSSDCFFFRDREFLNREDLRLHEIKSGAIYYTPIVYKEMNIARAEGDRIMVCYNGKCDMYVGIAMYWNGNVKMNALLDTQGSISFYQNGRDFSHTVDIPWYLKWLSPIVGVIVTIVVSVISDDLIKSIESRSSSISANKINTVTWCKNQAVVKSVYVSESLIFEY
ncbi:MAG: TULIP family P47-like protein [Methanosarcina sp.]|uniref:TULIP family P47-like protein n=1 Tax=Methanosarcina sp. TaxID=2213 RepID=UPI002609FBDE|nr:TULIP family P47-like protein [Methanosarcina sp.]MDD3247229.1 TULIP family P47-like protein [Methanosarcina sp.]MDD4248534.1 TULIP family P47-like protein [Methanosarcina sp.]